MCKSIQLWYAPFSHQSVSHLSTYEILTLLVPSVNPVNDGLHAGIRSARVNAGDQLVGLYIHVRLFDRSKITVIPHTNQPYKPFQSRSSIDSGWECCYGSPSPGTRDRTYHQCTDSWTSGGSYHPNEDHKLREDCTGLADLRPERTAVYSDLKRIQLY